MTFSCIYCQAGFTAHIKLKLLCKDWKACCVENGALRMFAQDGLLPRQLAAWSGRWAGYSSLLVVKSAVKGRHYVLIWIRKMHSDEAQKRFIYELSKLELAWLVLLKIPNKNFSEVGGVNVSFRPSPKNKFDNIQHLVLLNFSDLLWLYMFIMTDSYCLWDLGRTWKKDWWLS